VAGPDGHWGSATVRRVNEDGTFTIEPDEKPMLLMPNWYGVTPAEVSFNDAKRWTASFGRLTGGGDRLDKSSFSAALTALGFVTTGDQVQQFWVETCSKLFGLGKGPATDLKLDLAQGYVLCLAAGISAKRLDERLTGGGDPRSHYKLYWNLTRMGGREPDEIPRPVTLDDAFAAVGAAESAIDKRVVAGLRSFEEAHAVHLPEALKAFFSRRRICELVHECHPNNPDLVSMEEEGWVLRRELRSRGLGGDFAITVMLPHQGDHEWVAVFDDGDSDARLYVRWDGEEGEVWKLTAPGIGMFFWDLAQTGLAWYRETGFGGGPLTSETDIGLAVAERP
jgi:hypothetical protein